LKSGSPLFSVLYLLLKTVSLWLRPDQPLSKKEEEGSPFSGLSSS